MNPFGIRNERDDSRRPFSSFSAFPSKPTCSVDSHATFRTSDAPVPRHARKLDTRQAHADHEHGEDDQQRQRNAEDEIHIARPGQRSCAQTGHLPTVVRKPFTACAVAFGVDALPQLVRT